jgi:hypothetical protein
MKTALHAVAIVIIAVCAGIGTAYLADRVLQIKSKPVVLAAPFAAAVATAITLLRAGKPKRPSSP